MIVRKCDNCRKIISNNPIVVGVGFWPKIELCKNCALPVLKFLKDRQLLQKDLQDIGFTEAKAEV